MSSSGFELDPNEPAPPPYTQEEIDSKVELARQVSIMDAQAHANRERLETIIENDTNANMTSSGNAHAQAQVQGQRRARRPLPSLPQNIISNPNPTLSPPSSPPSQQMRPISDPYPSSQRQHHPRYSPPPHSSPPPHAPSSQSQAQLFSTPQRRRTKERPSWYEEAGLESPSSSGSNPGPVPVSNPRHSPGSGPTADTSSVPLAMSGLIQSMGGMGITEDPAAQQAQAQQIQNRQAERLRLAQHAHLRQQTFRLVTDLDREEDDDDDTPPLTTLPPPFEPVGPSLDGPAYSEAAPPFSPLPNPHDRLGLNLNLNDDEHDDMGDSTLVNGIPPRRRAPSPTPSNVTSVVESEVSGFGYGYNGYFFEPSPRRPNALTGGNYKAQPQSQSHSQPHSNHVRPISSMSDGSLPSQGRRTPVRSSTYKPPIPPMPPVESITIQPPPPLGPNANTNLMMWNYINPRPEQISKPPQSNVVINASAFYK